MLNEAVNNNHVYVKHVQLVINVVNAINRARVLVKLVMQVAINGKW